MVSWVSRMRVMRIGGTPMSLESTPAGDGVRLTLVPGSQTAAAHLVYVPDRFAATTTITCDGAAIGAARDPATGLVVVPCTGVLEATSP